MTITDDELIQALLVEENLQTADGSLTSNEIVRATGWSLMKVLRKLHAFADSGRLEVVQVRRPTLTGVIQTKPAYRLRGGEHETRTEEA